MPTPLAALASRHGLPALDTASVDKFLALEAGGSASALLFFTGDPVRWPEATDVAVVLPELLAAFAGRLRGAVIARDAESALMRRFGVNVLPSLVLVRRGRSVGVVPKIQDWSVYVSRIQHMLDAGEDDAIATQGEQG